VRVCPRQTYIISVLHLPLFFGGNSYAALMTRLNNVGDANFPICPKHDTFMVEYSFEPWEAILPLGTLEAFRCPNLECSIIYITGAAEGLYTLEPRGALRPYLSSGRE
jgi:hypothetical protein